MSLAFLFHYLMLNMFRMLIRQSSGACDLFVELFHGLYCSVRTEVFALAYLFSGECLVVTCVVVIRKSFSANTGCCGVFWLLSFLFCVVCFLMMFPEYILMSCIRTVCCYVFLPRVK